MCEHGVVVQAVGMDKRPKVHYACEHSVTTWQFFNNWSILHRAALDFVTANIRVRPITGRLALHINSINK